VSDELYAENSPSHFWRLLVDPPPAAETWAEAIRRSAAVLPPGPRAQSERIDSILTQTLGEGQFGPGHWELGHATRAYYTLKPLLPRSLTRHVKRAYGTQRSSARHLTWPIESRYVRFQFGAVRHLLQLLHRSSVPFIGFWPGGRRYAFVLTHDIETAEGQASALNVADLDARFGFRSSFNFVPERYRVDRGLMEELRARGFEIGLHGLRHDGKDFGSHRQFIRRAERMNRFIGEFGAVGFRAPLTLRNPEWMQTLDIEYDGSFFDTDPYEPIPGGTMCIWPFQLGKFIELPYTLAQDYTVAEVLGESQPRLWLEKVEFIRAHGGMALLNAHPDYLRTPQTWRMYSDFLSAMATRADFHHALPRELARWWRARAAAPAVQDLAGGCIAYIGVDGAITRSEPARPRDQCASRTGDVRSSAERIA